MNTETSPLEYMVYDAINEIQGIKRDSNRQPDYATKEEIFNFLRSDIMDALRKLYRKELIEFHKTVNGVEMFGIKVNNE